RRALRGRGTGLSDSRAVVSPPVPQLRTHPSAGRLAPAACVRTRVRERSGGERRAERVADSGAVDCRRGVGDARHRAVRDDRLHRRARGARVMDRHELAIVRTVVYASLFDYPLTIDQLGESLIGVSMTREEILARYESSRALRSAIEHRDGFFYPVRRSELVAERRRREARSRAFLARHARLLNWI